MEEGGSTFSLSGYNEYQQSFVIPRLWHYRSTILPRFPLDD